MPRERVHVRIDDATIAAGNPWVVVKPVACAALHSDPVEYELGLPPFSEAQRFVLGIQWYVTEVCNGGHRQFFSNGTGLVWRDALAGLKAVGAQGIAAALSLAVKKMDGAPELDRDECVQQLRRLSPDFEEADHRFYAALGNHKELEDQVMAFIRSRPKDFHFDGDVEM